MPPEVYRVMHFFGIMLLFLSLGGASLHSLNGGTRDTNSSRRWMFISHGIAMLLILVAGFGLLAKYKIPLGESPWVWGKLALWFILGGLIVLVQRVPAVARAMWVVLPALGAVAAYLAVVKPG